MRGFLIAVSLLIPLEFMCFLQAYFHLPHIKMSPHTCGACLAFTLTVR